MKMRLNQKITFIIFGYVALGIFLYSFLKIHDTQITNPTILEINGLLMIMLWFIIGCALVFIGYESEVHDG